MLKLLLALYIILLSACSQDATNKDKITKNTTAINKELSDKVSDNAIVPPSIPNLNK